MRLGRAVDMLRFRRKQNFVDLANHARDERRWELAAQLYRKALDRNPGNVGTWVQYGHALKESGQLRDPDKLAQAEVAYRRALSLEPGAADTHLQLGHVLKLQGKTEAAQAAYLRAFALDPAMPHPAHELRGLGWSETHMTELRGLVALDAADPLRPAVTTNRWTSVTDAEIHCLKKPSLLRDQVALFVTHSPNGRLRPHVRHYLHSLKRRSIAVLLIVATDQPFTDVDTDLLNAIDGIFVRQNQGYDFAAWAHIFRLHPELYCSNIVYLLNDSVIGPTNEVTFANLLGRLHDSPADFIGSTESFEQGWHFQSYFLALKPRALSSVAFREFINDIVSYNEDVREEVIRNYELRFASTMKAAGLNCEPMFRATDDRNPTTHHWRYLLQSGFPFIKVEVIRGLVPELDVSDWQKLLAAQGYDVSLAERTLAEFSLALVDKNREFDAVSATAVEEGPNLRARIEASGLFDPDVYLSLHQDLRAMRVDPWKHFLNYGLKEARHFTNSSVVARLLARMDPELKKARDRFIGAANEAVKAGDNSELADLFRQKKIRIGVFWNSQGNFFIREIAEILVWGLCAEGIDAVLRDERADKNEGLDLRIFVAPHEFYILGEGGTWKNFASAPNTVFYATEQPQTHWFCYAFPYLLKARLVLDINFQTAEILRRAGCNVVHFMPGYLPALPHTHPYTDISGVELVKGYSFARQAYNWLDRDNLAERPIDILFIGSHAPRRDKALSRLRELSDTYRFLCVYTPQEPLREGSNCSTSTAINCALAQRTRIVLNIHRDWLGYFEWSRMVLQGFWQGACVVSDHCLPNPIFEAGTHYLEENARNIGELVRWLLETQEGRRKLDTTRVAAYERARRIGSMRVALAPVLKALKEILAI
jgi:hypothetical protein